MLRALAILAASGGMLSAAAVEYEIRPSGNNRLALVVEKTGLMSGRKHLFVFERFRGTILHDPEAPERSRAEVVVEAAGIACLDDWVDEKDRRKIVKVALEDMMDAARHPELRFVSTAARRTGADSFEVQGTLTIRGIAKPVVLAVKTSGGHGALTSVSGEGVIRLRDYGLKPPGALLGAIGTKNEMRVEFKLQALPRPAAPAAARGATGRSTVRAAAARTGSSPHTR